MAGDHLQDSLEDRLRSSEALFRNFFNLPLVGAAITSREKGWIEVNDQTCKIPGYTREELFAKDWAELTHPDDLARLVKAHLRSIDVLARWGGEEFVVLLPNSTVSNAETVAEKLRLLIDQAAFDPVGRATASFGVTQLIPGEKPEAVFSRVDKAMYQAKSAGRNRVMSA